jgi:hypothetical protein
MTGKQEVGWSKADLSVLIRLSSLYGSMTRSAVISLLNSRCAMILAPTRTAPVWPPIPRIGARRICLVSSSDAEFKRREATRLGAS